MHNDKNQNAPVKNNESVHIASMQHTHKNLNSLIMINEAIYKVASEQRDQANKVAHLQRKPHCWLQPECCECEVSG